jgi:hypothetical protein
LGEKFRTVMVQVEFVQHCFTLGDPARASIPAITWRTEPKLRVIPDGSLIENVVTDLLVKDIEAFCVDYLASNRARSADATTQPANSDRASIAEIDEFLRTHDAAHAASQPAPTSQPTTRPAATRPTAP